jgi:uncharacterized membrane protein YeaQ/YmgE (transglycosylase-associated protein family)
MSMQAVAISLAVGLAVGWLASLVVGDTALPPLVVIGILGAFLGDVAFENIGLTVGDPLVAQIVFTAVGAIVLIVLGRILLRYYPP